jgi:hypothetical protein
MNGEKEGRVVHTEQVAHVTFSITEVIRDSGYDLYAESKNDGLKRLEWGVCYDYAIVRLQQEIDQLEQKLEHKRKGMPTAKQLHFLFRERIPIPPDLTWGQASDLIEERMAQIELEKEARQKAKLEQALQGKAVMPRQRDDFPYHPGDKVIHAEHGRGVVVHAGFVQAYVQFESVTKTLPLVEIEPEKQEGTC